MQAVSSPSASDQDVPRRLVEGLAAAIAEKGYAQTTIADIVRHARVSKRTFYEHFTDKETCFLAGYVALSEETLRIIAAAAAIDGTWEERVHAAARAYLAALESKPELTRTYLLEIHAAGPRALDARRHVHRKFAEQMRTLVDAAREDQPDLSPLSEAMATALVGGINELVLVAAEGKKAARLAELTETAAALVIAVVKAPSAPRAPRRARAK